MTQNHRDSRSRFHWQLLAASSLLTVAILGGVVPLGWGFYSGTLKRLADKQSVLAVTQQRVIKESARPDELTRKVNDDNFPRFRAEYEVDY